MVVYIDKENTSTFKRFFFKNQYDEKWIEVSIDELKNEFYAKKLTEISIDFQKNEHEESLIHLLFSVSSWRINVFPGAKT